MKAQSGNQADNTIRYSAGNNGKRVMLGDRLIGETVLSPGDTLDGSFADKPCEDLTVDSMAGCLFGGEHPPLPGKLQSFFDLRSLHV
jgi:hypothetical protein